MKILKKYITGLFIIILFPINIFGQDYNYHPCLEISAIAEKNMGNGFVEFKEELDLHHNTIFQNYSHAFGLTKHDAMMLNRTSYNKNIPELKHYQQYHKGLQVEGGEYVVHEKNGTAIWGNGKIIQNIDIPETPAISSELGYSPIKIYLTQAPDSLKYISFTIKIRDIKDNKFIANTKQIFIKNKVK